MSTVLVQQLEHECLQKVVKAYFHYLRTTLVTTDLTLGILKDPSSVDLRALLLSGLVDELRFPRGTSLAPETVTLRAGEALEERLLSFLIVAFLGL